MGGVLAINLGIYSRVTRDMDFTVRNISLSYVNHIAHLLTSIIAHGNR